MTSSLSSSRWKSSPPQSSQMPGWAGGSYSTCQTRSQRRQVRRLSGRRTCRRCERVWHVLYDPPARDGICDDCGGELFQRDDDSEETIRHRLEVYAEQTSPLISFYADENILIGIDATGPVEEITSRAMAALRPFVR